MNYDDIILKAVEKYNYGEKVASLLKRIVPAMIKFYGEDRKDCILKALLNCEIHIEGKDENRKEYLNSFFGTNEEWKMPITAGAFAHKGIKKEGGKIVSKSINYIRTKYLREYKEPDFSSPKIISYIVHELCHAAKTSDSIEKDGDDILIRSGVSKEIYHDDGESFSQIGDQYLGLEEGLNSLEEAEIMSIILGEKQDYGAYKTLTSAARRLLEDEKLAYLLRRCQFEGDYEWIDYLGEDAKLVIDCFDAMYNANYSQSDEVRQKYDEAIDIFLDFMEKREKKNNLDEMLESSHESIESGKHIGG